jgi:hypothetical protein
VHLWAAQSGGTVVQWWNDACQQFYGEGRE